MRFRLAPLGMLLAFVSPALADYGDMPPQPGDDDYVAPSPQTPSNGPSVHFEGAAGAIYLAPPIRGGTNPFGFGFGGRAGLLVGSHFYAGFALVGYLGGSDVTLSDNSLLVGGELGWDFVLYEAPHLRVSLRPLVGVGNASVSHTDPSIVANAKPDVVTTASGRVVSGGKPSATQTVNDVYVQPKLALVLEHDWHFVALEADGLILPSISYGGADPTTWLSYGAQLQAGVRF